MTNKILVVLGMVIFLAGILVGMAAFGHSLRAPIPPVGATLHAHPTDTIGDTARVLLDDMTYATVTWEDRYQVPLCYVFESDMEEWRRRVKAKQNLILHRQMNLEDLHNYLRLSWMHSWTLVHGDSTWVTVID